MKYLLLVFTSFILFLGSNYVDLAAENKNSISESEVANQEQSMNKDQLRHVVLFKFKESASREDIAEVEKAFSALPGKIPEIKDYEWGTNNSPEGLDKGFTHCFFVTFESEEDRATYLPHPEHKAFVEVLEPHMEDVLVVDYWAKDK